MKKLFFYIEPIWLDPDGKVSIRRVLTLIFSFNLVVNTHHAIFNLAAGVGYGDVALILGIESGLIAALLSLTTYSGIKSSERFADQSIDKNPDNDFNPPT